MPEASIIVPLLNQVDAWLEQAVSSALKQTVPSEVVVVTSPATRESNLRVIETLQSQHRNLKVLAQQPGTGFAAALNAGIRQAATGRIGFLMSDDWLQPTAVEACLPHVADIVSTARRIFAADGITALADLDQPHTWRDYTALKTPAERANFLGHFLLFRKEALEWIGGVDESLGNSPGVDDFDLIWCLLEQRASVAVIPEALYNYRDHEGERLTKLQREDMLVTFHRILDKHALSARQRRKILREHTPWFGTSMWVRYRQLSPEREMGPIFGRLQKMYRNTVPLRTRISIHESFISRFMR